MQASSRCYKLGMQAAHALLSGRRELLLSVLILRALLQGTRCPT